jgi:hypothetical protein
MEDTPDHTAARIVHAIELEAVCGRLRRGEPRERRATSNDATGVPEVRLRGPSAWSTEAIRPNVNQAIPRARATRERRDAAGTNVKRVLVRNVRWQKSIRRIARRDAR